MSPISRPTFFFFAQKVISEAIGSNEPKKEKILTGKSVTHEKIEILFRFGVGKGNKNKRNKMESSLLNAFNQPSIQKNGRNPLIPVDYFQKNLDDPISVNDLYITDPEEDLAFKGRE